MRGQIPVKIIPKYEVTVSDSDWFRNKEWNDEIEIFFYSKLKRARSQRDQYMVIQALTLTENHPLVTLRLVEEYFATRSDQLDDVRALLARANAYETMKEWENAAQAYIALLKREEELPSHTTGAYLDYPFMVATVELEAEYERAIKVLDNSFDRLTFPLDYFRWYASYALLGQDRLMASKALDAAKIEKSGFRYHQDLGLVGREHRKTIKKLQELLA